MPYPTETIPKLGKSGSVRSWEPAPRFRILGRFQICRQAEALSGKALGEIRTRTARQMFIDTDLSENDVLAAVRFAGWAIPPGRIHAWCKPPLTGGDVAIKMGELAAIIWAATRLKRAFAAGYPGSIGRELERSITCRDCGASYRLRAIRDASPLPDDVVCQCGESVLREPSGCVWEVSQTAVAP